jgi:hypothetical protein
MNSMAGPFNGLSLHLKYSPILENSESCPVIRGLCADKAQVRVQSSPHQIESPNTCKSYHGTRKRSDEIGSKI